MQIWPNFAHSYSTGYEERLRKQAFRKLEKNRIEQIEEQNLK